MAQLELSVVDANEDHPAGIAFLFRDMDIIEDEGQLVPSGVMTREQALLLAYKLGELAQKLPQE